MQAFYRLPVKAEPEVCGKCRRLSPSIIGMMAIGLRSRGSWLVCLVCILAIGILSRVVQTGFVVLDKYLGDALYAAMVYAILRLLMWGTSVAVPTALIMIGIELFQLTMIPARMLGSEHMIVKICARLLGSEFSFLDLLAYGTGIACIHLADFSGT
jgi:hypothetical protein